MSKETGGPAFPCGTGWDSQGQWIGGDDEGMTLRDYFAAKAMQGLLADPNCCLGTDKIAETSYILADAMLKERNK